MKPFTKSKQPFAKSPDQLIHAMYNLHAWKFCKRSRERRKHLLIFLCCWYL